MKTIKIENKQKKNRKWSEAEVLVPESFRELADKFHDGDLLKAGNALFAFVMKPANLHVALRQQKEPQIAANRIFSGIESGMITISQKLSLAQKVENLLKDGKLDNVKLALLLTAKTSKEKLSLVQKFEAEAEAEAQEQKAEAEAETKADPETPKPKPKPKAKKPKAKPKAKKE